MFQTTNQLRLAGTAETPNINRPNKLSLRDSERSISPRLLPLFTGEQGHDQVSTCGCKPGDTPERFGPLSTPVLGWHRTLPPKALRCWTNFMSYWTHHFTPITTIVQLAETDFDFNQECRISDMCLVGFEKVPFPLACHSWTLKIASAAHALHTKR